MMEEEVLSLIAENFSMVSRIINTIKFLTLRIVIPGELMWWERWHILSLVGSCSPLQIAHTCCPVSLERCWEWTK